MKALVFHGIGDIRLENVPEPKIQKPTDAIVRLTASAICGTDLHFVRGTADGMKPGTILGHEGVGIVLEVGSDVRNFKPGDRVIIPSTIACGVCVYCRAGYTGCCDKANPNGPQAGTAYYGGPESSGPFQGLQAELARVPFAYFNLVKIPDRITDAQAIALSDVFPTGYFGAILAEIKSDDVVAVFGCGPVGLFAIASAQLMGAGRIFAVDMIADRLEAAQSLGAEAIDFSREDPVEAIRRATDGVGVDRAIDAVGVDAVRPHHGPALQKIKKHLRDYQEELKEVAPRQKPVGPNWHPGDAPSLALEWAIDVLAKAGTLSIVGLYPDSLECFPIGLVCGKNLAINAGACHHRRLIPKLLRMIEAGTIDPSKLVTHRMPLTGAVEAYKAFDTRQPGWIKVEFDVVPKMSSPLAPEDGSRRRVAHEAHRKLSHSRAGKPKRAAARRPRA
jgi:threonine dehydrogenase-like Zn-dependent dehydrogenase